MSNTKILITANYGENAVVTALQSCVNGDAVHQFVPTRDSFIYEKNVALFEWTEEYHPRLNIKEPVFFNLAKTASMIVAESLLSKGRVKSVKLVWVETQLVFTSPCGKQSFNMLQSASLIFDVIVKSCIDRLRHDVKSLENLPVNHPRILCQAVNPDEEDLALLNSDTVACKQSSSVIFEAYEGDTKTDHHSFNYGTCSFIDKETEVLSSS